MHNTEKKTEINMSLSGSSTWCCSSEMGGIKVVEDKDVEFTSCKYIKNTSLYKLREMGCFTL